MKKNATITLLIALLIELGLNSTRGQTYAIDWHKISGGGGVSSNAQYQVTGTIGQHDASGSVSGGGRYSITGGFWSLFAVQTSGAPLLKLFLTTTNTAVILWPSASSGWIVQQNTDLGTTNWVAPSETVNDDGVNRFIIVNPPGENRFFRLAKP